MNEKSIIFFDGVCNFCNGTINLVLKNDKKNKFQFASLQSDFAQKTLSSEYTSSLDTMVLMQEGKIYTKSTAALKIAKALGLPYSLLYAFIILPDFIRDAGYNLIAKNRYKWFGRQDSCMVPTPDARAKFLG